MSTTLDTAAKVKAIYGGTWEAWGGGRVPIGVGSNGTTNYSTPEATGGSENHRHDFKIGMHAYYGGVIDDNWISGANGTGAYSYSQNKFSKQIDSAGNTATKRNDRMNQTMVDYSEWTRVSTGDTDVADSKQPYITVYMWKRTA